MKKILALLFLLGCSGQLPSNFATEDSVHSGTVCQGSKAWKQRNICGEGNESGLCIRIIDGPLTLTEFRTSESCPHEIHLAVKDTFMEDDVKPRWEMKSQPMIPFVLQNVSITIRSGESLFVGTDGYNSKVDSSCCYVTWAAYKPQVRFEEE